MIILPHKSALEDLDDEDLKQVYTLALDLKLENDFIELVRGILKDREL